MSAASLEQSGPAERVGWLSGGVRFECQRCQRCCQAHDRHCWVYLDDGELTELATLLGREAAELEQALCARHRGQRVLRFVDGCCPLHDGQGCTAYEARPVQCVTWPFWPENIYSAKAWERSVASGCPGAGQGRRWSQAEVLAQARRMREHDQRT